jgi:hypothetical protein
MSEKPSLNVARRKNGHKMTCPCHICENMKKKEARDGYKEDARKLEEKKRGGSGKKNGHKPDCKCQICKNMIKKTRKNRVKRGGDGEDERVNTTTDQGTETFGNDKEVEELELEGGESVPSSGGTRRRRNKRRKSSRRSKKRMQK